MAVSVYVSLTLLYFATRVTGQHGQTHTVRALPLATPGGEADGSCLRRVVWRLSACRRHTPPSPAHTCPGLCIASALLLLVSGRLGSTALTVTCAGKESDVN